MKKERKDHIVDSIVNDTLPDGETFTREELKAIVSSVIHKVDLCTAQEISEAVPMRFEIKHWPDESIGNTNQLQATEKELERIIKRDLGMNSCEEYLEHPLFLYGQVWALQSIEDSIYAGEWMGLADDEVTIEN